MSDDAALDVAGLSDTGTSRDHNEDACGVFHERRDCALAAVADGVSSGAAGELASQMAVEILLREFREQGPGVPAGQRLYRAVQQANIEIYDRAVAVPELRGMSTTLTSAVVEDGALTAVHVGDSRLYLLRGGALTQLTKDHTLAAEKARYGLMSKERARTHADRCVLTRSVGRELIVSRDPPHPAARARRRAPPVQRRVARGARRRRAGAAPGGGQRRRGLPSPRRRCERARHARQPERGGGAHPGRAGGARRPGRAGRGHAPDPRPLNERS